MAPDDELALVKKAILLGKTVTGCFEWHERATDRVRHDPELRGFTTTAIRRLALEFFVAGGTIQQIKEQRPEYNDFEYYYKLIIPNPEFPNGLFVEMRLFDSDEDCPTVLLVNAHPQQK